MHRPDVNSVWLAGLLTLTLAACSQGYSPNIYASNAAQVEATVQRGTIIGVREIIISPDGTVGAAAGGAVGGVAGSQVAGAPVVTALGAIGGSLVGGIGGAAAAQAVGKVKGWEYIVQEEPGDKLVSVTQTSKIALPIGLRVLVISGSQQARIVPDYTVQVAAAPAASAAPKPDTAGGPVEIDINPALPDSEPAPVAPVTVAPVAGTPVAAAPVAAAPVTVASGPPAAAPKNPAPAGTP